MKSNLILGNTMKTDKQTARDAVRALNSARINLNQSKRFNLNRVARDEAAVAQLKLDVAFWKARGLV